MKNEAQRKTKIKDFVKETLYQTKLGVRLFVMLIAVFYITMFATMGAKWLITECFAASGYKTTVKVNLTYDDNKDSGDLTKVLNLKKYLKKGDSFKKSSVETTLAKGNQMMVDTYAKGKTGIRVVYGPIAEESLDYTCDYSYTVKTKKNGRVTLKFHCKHIADDAVRAEAEAEEAYYEQASNNDYDPAPAILKREDSPKDHIYFNKIVEKLKADTGGMSEKDALDTIETYFVWHMDYDHDLKFLDYDNKIPNAWEQIWNGTYKGVCGEGAQRAVLILRALGYDAVYVSHSALHHAWTCVRTTDTVTGTEYWRGISATADAYHIATFNDGKWDWYPEAFTMDHKDGGESGKEDFTPYHRQDGFYADYADDINKGLLIIIKKAEYPSSSPDSVREGRFY